MWAKLSVFLKEIFVSILNLGKGKDITFGEGLGKDLGKGFTKERVWGTRVYTKDNRPISIISNLIISNFL